MLKKIIFAFITTIVLISCSTSEDNDSPNDDNTTIESDDEVSNNDENEVEVEEPLAPELLKIKETSFYENQKDGTRVFYFEDNQRTLDSVFNENDVFVIKVVRDYNNLGLQNKIIRYDSNGEIISETSILYENNLISEIDESENTEEGTFTRNISLSYSESEIIATIQENQSNELSQTIYGLNENGIVFSQDNGQTIVKINYSENRPISKTTIVGSSEQNLNFTYLENPTPKNPWNNISKNQYGELNNQLIFYGLFDFQDFVNFDKYMDSYGDFNILYEFNDKDLPIKIESSNGQKQVIKEIEYQN
ncbi:MAG: hypothetical protein NXH90_14165 [Flavobacteriaceae bacterium]|nr:hypothetical protein [Flavobacteriaceae bacterium]